MTCDSSVVHFSLLDRLAISLAACSFSHPPPILFYIVEILRKFKASKVNSLQSESIQQKKERNPPDMSCFITPYDAIVLPFLLVTTVDHSRMDARFNTLPCSVQQHCQFLSLLNAQSENKIFVSDYCWEMFPY